MKKAFTIALIIFLALSVNVYAGSARITNTDRTSRPDSKITIAASGDSISAVTIPATSYEPGSYIYSIDTYPSTPDGTYTVTISNSGGLAVCTAADRSTSANEEYSCHNTTGQFSKIYGALSVAIGDLGAGSATIVVNIVK